MEEKYSIYMRRGRRKKKINPQTMLHWEYSVRTEKKTPQHKSTYTIDTTCNRGKHIQLWQAAIRSGAICGAGHRPARQVAVQSVQRQFGRGRGVMSVIGEGTRASRCSVLSQGYISNNDLAGQCWYGGAKR